LEQHLHAVEALEKSLHRSQNAKVRCHLEPLPGIVNTSKNYEAIGRQQMDLLVHALSCDLTRVATLQWSFASGTHVFSDLDMSSGHHHITHQGRARFAKDPTGAQPAIASSIEIAVRQLQTIEQWYALQFSYLLGKMRAIPEGDGTMLDNSLVFWCNELDEPWSHRHNNMPFVLAGRCGGSIRPGRRIRYTSRSHNDLLSAILNLMDVPTTDFGDPDFCVAPLTGLGG